MSSKYKFSDNDHLYFTSFAVVDWVDVFTRREYKDIAINSIKYCQENKGLELFAWVIMTNHVHLIIRSSKNSMSDILVFRRGLQCVGLCEGMRPRRYGG